MKKLFIWMCICSCSFFLSNEINAQNALPSVKLETTSKTKVAKVSPNAIQKKAKVQNVQVNSVNSKTEQPSVKAIDSNSQKVAKVASNSEQQKSVMVVNNVEKNSNTKLPSAEIQMSSPDKGQMSSASQQSVSEIYNIKTNPVSKQKPNTVITGTKN